MPKRGDWRCPSFWELQAIGWGSSALIAFVCVLPYVHGAGELRKKGLYLVSCFAATIVLRPICRSLVRRSLPVVSLMARIVGCSVVVGTGAALLSEVITVDSRPLDLAAWLAGSAIDFVILLLWCSLYFTIKIRLQFEQEREHLLVAEAREAKLLALKYQLSPHFLFNSLNAVSTLVLQGNSAAATRMLAQIAEFLRVTLDDQIVTKTALSQEITLTKTYLAIEKTRLGERLHVDFEVSPDTLDAVVPMLLLQPLVENAVRHGVASQVEGGIIRIYTGVRTSYLRITVTNTGCHENKLQQQMASGVGLKNVAERLRTLYGPDHTFSLEWPTAGGCTVTIEVPLRRASFS